MTPEQRLDRIERLAQLLVKAGLPSRNEHREKISTILRMQMENKERFAKLAEAMKKLAESQARLDASMASLRNKRNGESTA